MKQKFVFFLKHFLVVLLSFSIEITVKAQEYSVENQKGKIEVEKLPDGSTDIQTHAGAFLKVKYKGVHLGIKENSFVTLSHKLQLHYGVLFVQNKNEDKFNLHTRQGILSSEKESIFIVKTNSQSTAVAVLMGEASLDDRVQKNKKTLKAGYEISLGGLYAHGDKKWGALQAHDVQANIQTYNLFSDEDDINKNITIDHLRIAWKGAVEQVAENTQKEVKNDLVVLKSHQHEQRKRQIASELERKKMKEHFRLKTTGVPGQSKEVPLE